MQDILENKCLRSLEPKNVDLFNTLKFKKKIIFDNYA